MHVAAAVGGGRRSGSRMGGRQGGEEEEGKRRRRQGGSSSRLSAEGERGQRTNNDRSYELTRRRQMIYAAGEISDQVCLKCSFLFRIDKTISVWQNQDGCEVLPPMKLAEESE